MCYEFYVSTNRNLLDLDWGFAYFLHTVSTIVFYLFFSLYSGLIMTKTHAPKNTVNFLLEV